MAWGGISSYFYRVGLCLAQKTTRMLARDCKKKWFYKPAKAILEHSKNHVWLDESSPDCLNVAFTVESQINNLFSSNNHSPLVLKKKPVHSRYHVYRLLNLPMASSDWKVFQYYPVFLKGKI